EENCEIDGVQPRLPADARAAELYRRASAFYCGSFDADHTIAVLDELLQREPQFALGWAMRASAHTALDEHGDEDARRALALLPTVSGDERLWVEALARTALPDGDFGLAALQTLVNHHPNHICYGAMLATAQAANGKQVEGLATIDRLH